MNVSDAGRRTRRFRNIVNLWKSHRNRCRIGRHVIRCVKNEFFFYVYCINDRCQYILFLFCSHAVQNFLAGCWSVLCARVMTNDVNLRCSVIDCRSKICIHVWIWNFFFSRIFLKFLTFVRLRSCFLFGCSKQQKRSNQCWRRPLWRSLMRFKMLFHLVCSLFALLLHVLIFIITLTCFRVCWQLFLRFARKRLVQALRK